MALFLLDRFSDVRGAAGSSSVAAFVEIGVRISGPRRDSAGCCPQNDAPHHSLPESHTPHPHCRLALGSPH